MENLNAEQIIKALECCIEGECDGCTYDEQTACKEYLLHDALALIKELTEKNKNLEQAYECADSARRELSSECDRLTEENERLRGFNSAKCEDCAGCTAWNCDCANIEADTVRKMQERLKMYFGTYTLGYKIPLNEVLKVINQIAKEASRGEG